MISIRYARNEDVAALVEIGLAAWESAASGVADLTTLRDNARIAFHRFLADQWLTVILAEGDGVPAGWIAREARDDQISDLWVLPELHRQGVGSALLLAMEDEMRTTGFAEAGLQTHARNEQAIAFFRRHDYAVAWLSTSYVARMDSNMESIGMRKPLAASQPVSTTEWF